jgi:manganese transport protein
MPRSVPLRSRLLSILFWSVIAAAFIGPGTVTTAAAAGAQFKLGLLWALVFSTGACLLLQEAAARVTIASGYSLGEAIARQYRARSAGRFVSGAVGGAVVFGCAAYQAGNILGAVAGLSLVWSGDGRWLTVAVAGGSGLLLWLGSYRVLTNVLGLMVAGMGLAFVTVALSLEYAGRELLFASLVPTFPAGSSLLLIGLIGTTIVPYNLFLGSGLSQGQSLSEMRFGLSVAVVGGGLISGAILVVGTLVEAPFQFEALLAQLTGRLGPWAGILLGVGLFSAGFTSCVTAPLASALTARSLFSGTGRPWEPSSWPYRLTWLTVLGTGFAFGLGEYRPVPAIILAQGINGLLLPFIAVFLLLVVNDPAVMPRSFLNSPLNNALLLLVVGLTTFLGLTNVVRAAAAGFGSAGGGGATVLWVLFSCSLLFSGLVAYHIARLRKKRLNKG